MLRSRGRGRGGSGGAAPSFSPTDIAGCALWLDAADAATLWADTAGTIPATSTVGRFSDKSGNARHATQGTVANQPTTGIRTINGKNVIDFDGTNDWMTLASAISRTGGFTVFFAGIVDDTATTKYVLSGTVAGAFQIRFSTAEAIVIVRQGQAVLLTSTSTGLTSALVAMVKSSSAGNSIEINGISDGSNATNNGLTDDPNNIGSNNGANDFFKGGWGEFIVYTSILSAPDTATVKAYLAAKWGTP